MPDEKSRRYGSSPLARGLQDTAIAFFKSIGIIPARAGFTRLYSGTTANRRDHPRSRGVYRRIRHSSSMTRGSSPLARGLRRGTCPPTTSPGDHPRSRGVYRAELIRIVREAGSSPLARGLLQKGEEAQEQPVDHPRSRGVYQSYAVSWTGAPGSSPLARGLLGGGVERDDGARIIPARAGFTHWRDSTSGRTPDHPRSRGVYSLIGNLLGVVGGSSPLARGLREAGVGGDHGGGIIPARAGFTGARSPATCPCPDHPRSRGVYASRLKGLAGSVGSSPLARGLLAERLRVVVVLGIIPARAGFTALVTSVLAAWGDHPRSRGVYADRPESAGIVGGSSPLARGLLVVARPPAVPFRIIPARAGFTPPT